MSFLTLIDGGNVKPKPFAMNAHGVAKFMIAGAHAARKVIENYAFPNEEKARIIVPVPAKGIVFEFFKGGRSVEYIDSVISQNEHGATDEKPFERSRRRSALSIAKNLKAIGPKLNFTDVRRPRVKTLEISGLRVRASVDFTCKLPNGRVGAVIYNVASEIAGDDTKLHHYALAESEMAWQILRNEIPDLAEVWYIDGISNKVIRKHIKSMIREWRNVEVTCDNILTSYLTILSRRQRPGQSRA